MPRARSLDDVIERRRRERDADGDRYVDLRIDFVMQEGRTRADVDGVDYEDVEEVIHDAVLEGRHGAVRAINQEVVDNHDAHAQTAAEIFAHRVPLSVGDRWDRRLGDFDGEAKTGVMVRFHRGQLRAVEWFAGWIAKHRDRRETPAEFDPNRVVMPDEVYSALFAGGRRGGKTYIAEAFGVAYAAEFPGSIVWMGSPSNERHDEVRRYVAEFVPAEWLDGETQEGWELVNGSRLILKSAFGTGDQLKEGKANLVILNEGQKMKERAFVVSRGAIVDSSGLVIVCANPPSELKDEQWVANFAADALAHRRAAVYLHFNPLDNPHIDRAGLLSMAQEVDERTYAIEVLGQFLPPRDVVVYNWIRLENELPTPNARWDVTTQFLDLIGEGTGIKQVVGLDVQRFPYIGGPVYKFFGKPTYDDVLMWAVDEAVLDGGDELEWCGVLEEKGYKPEETLIICDASGRYQHSRRRSADSPPPEWKGRGSFDLIRGAGYTLIKPPDRRQKRNPEIVDRVRAFTSLVATKTGKRRLFVDPDAAPRTCAAIREWRTKNGTPSRSQYEAHLGDGASYPVVRFFPRRLRSLDLREASKSTNPPRIADAPVPGTIEAPRIGDHVPRPEREGRRARR